MVGPFSLSSDVLLNVAMPATVSGGYGSEHDANLVGMKITRRELSTAENSGNIQGKLVVGDNNMDKEKYPEDHFLKVNGVGLPSDCTGDCSMAIALANSRECTEDVHNSAQKVLLQPTLFYSTDEAGCTGGWLHSSRGGAPAGHWQRPTAAPVSPASAPRAPRAPPPAPGGGSRARASGPAAPPSMPPAGRGPSSKLAASCPSG